MARPSLPQFEPDYDFYKMRTLVDELNRWIETVESGESGAGGAAGDHNTLTGRSAADAHPTSAITGLDATLLVFSNHIADATIHFTEASIDHANILNIGINSHAAIDAHIASLANPHDVDLQQAYDEDTSVPQITLNGTPDPFTIDASVAGDIFALRDTANADLVRFATTGSLIHGGVGSGDILGLRGSSDAGLGVIDVQSPSFYSYDWTLVSPANVNVITYDAVIASTGAAVTSFILVDPDFTIDSGLFIPSTIRDIGNYNQAVAPGFAVHTVFLGQPTLETTTALIQPNQSFMYASQALYENVGAGAVATHVANIIGMTHNPRLGTRVFGDTLNVTNLTGISVAPGYGTVAGTAVDFGTIRWVTGVQPALSLFQPGAGVETMDALYGMDFPGMTFDATAPKSVVRSSLALNGSLNHFLQNLSTAPSEFGTSVAHFNDSGVIQFGGALNAADVSLFWNGAGFWEMFFWSTSDFLEWSSPAADRFLLEPNAASGGEFDLNFDIMGFGTVAVGNNAFSFAQNARTVTVGGGYASAVFTAAANLNFGVLAMSDVSAWAVNALSFDNTAYSIAELATFRIGGMTTSNPGGTVTERSALRVTGRHLQRGSWQTEPINPAALVNGNNNDWAGLLTGSPSNNTRFWARVGSAAGAVLTGIDSTAVQDGDTFKLTNISVNTITVTNQDVASVAANRIDLGSWSGTWTVDDSFEVKYDSTSGFWRVTGSQIA